MNFFEHDEQLYEFTTLSPTGSDDWVVECVEMSNPAGFVGSITVSIHSEQSTLKIHAGTSLPLPVLRHWMSVLPEALESSSED